jgi:hypothetical protein
MTAISKDIYLDSGATRHMSGDESLVTDLHIIPNNSWPVNHDLSSQNRFKVSHSKTRVICLTSFSITFKESPTMPCSA